jgi:hypothetical protein
MEYEKSTHVLTGYLKNSVAVGLLGSHKFISSRSNCLFVSVWQRQFPGVNTWQLLVGQKWVAMGAAYRVDSGSRERAAVVHHA